MFTKIIDNTKGLFNNILHEAPPAPNPNTNVINIDDIESVGNGLTGISDSIKNISDSLHADIIEFQKFTDIVVRIYDILSNPIIIWKFILSISHYGLLLVAMVSLILYVCGYKSCGKHIPGSIVIYLLIQSINTVFI